MKRITFKNSGGRNALPAYAACWNSVPATHGAEQGRESWVWCTAVWCTAVNIIQQSTPYGTFAPPVSYPDEAVQLQGCCCTTGWHVAKVLQRRLPAGP